MSKYKEMPGMRDAEHVAMTVPDLDTACKFFEEVMGRSPGASKWRTAESVVSRRGGPARYSRWHDRHWIIVAASWSRMPRFWRECGRCR